MVWCGAVLCGVVWCGVGYRYVARDLPFGAAPKSGRIDEVEVHAPCMLLPPPELALRGRAPHSASSSDRRRTERARTRVCLAVCLRACSLT